MTLAKKIYDIISGAPTESPSFFNLLSSPEFASIAIHGGYKDVIRAHLLDPLMLHKYMELHPVSELEHTPISLFNDAATVHKRIYVAHNFSYMQQCFQSTYWNWIPGAHLAKPGELATVLRHVADAPAGEETIGIQAVTTVIQRPEPDAVVALLPEYKHKAPGFPPGLANAPGPHGLPGIAARIGAIINASYPGLYLHSAFRLQVHSVPGTHAVIDLFVIGRNIDREENEAAHAVVIGGHSSQRI